MTGGILSWSPKTHWDFPSIPRCPQSAQIAEQVIYISLNINRSFN